MKVDLRNLNTKKEMRNNRDIVTLLNKEEGDLSLLIILCPLFKNGTLVESSLLSGNNCSIENSRINLKWAETKKFINCLHKEMRGCNKKIHIDFLFADNGVPMISSNNFDIEILKEHLVIWQDEIENFLMNKDIGFEIIKFRKIVPEIPVFLNINESEFLRLNSINRNDIKVDFINKLNIQLEAWFKDSIDIPHIEIDRKNKKRVSRLLSVFSLDSAFVMCSTYLAKRFRLPKIFNNSVFVWFERMDVLLTMDDMLEEFKDVRKIMIKV